MFRRRYKAGLIHFLDPLCCTVAEISQFWNRAFLTALCNTIFQRSLNTIHILPLKPQIHLTGISVLGDREIHGILLQLPANVGQRFLIYIHRCQRAFLPVERAQALLPIILAVHCLHRQPEYIKNTLAGKPRSADFHANCGLFNHSSSLLATFFRTFQS